MKRNRKKKDREREYYEIRLAKWGPGKVQGEGERREKNQLLMKIKQIYVNKITKHKLQSIKLSYTTNTLWTGCHVGEHYLTTTITTIHHKPNPLSKHRNINGSKMVLVRSEATAFSKLWQERLLPFTKFRSSSSPRCADSHATHIHCR